MFHDAVIKANEEVRRARDEVQRAAGQINIHSSDNGSMKTTKIDIGKAQIVFSDDKGEMKIEPVDGKKVLTAKDPQGKLLFSGPVETKEDLDKVPADVRQRFDKLQDRDIPSVTFSDDDEDADVDDGDDDNGASNGPGVISPRWHPSQSMHPDLCRERSVARFDLGQRTPPSFLTWFGQPDGSRAGKPLGGVLPAITYEILICRYLPRACWNRLRLCSKPSAAASKRRRFQRRRRERPCELLRSTNGRK